MKLRPLSDHIVVDPDAPPEFSDGGIALLPAVDTGFVKEIVRGRVVAVGPGKMKDDGSRESMWGISVGNEVAYSPVCQVKFNDMVIIRRDAVTGVYE